MDENTFVANIQSCKGTLYKLVRLYAQDQEEQKDLLQEILLNAWQGAKHFRGESSFNTWLYRISINTIFTAKRKQKGPVARQNQIELQAHHATVISSDAYEDLYAAIKQLNESDRLIIQMQLDGYSNNEMADMIGISENHVAVKLYRIRKNLSKWLKNQIQ